MTSPTTFAIGAQVSFVTMRQSKQAVKFSAREGVVLALNGDHAVVKTRSGSLHEVPIEDMRAKGLPNALTDAVLSAFGGETK